MIFNPRQDISHGLVVLTRCAGPTLRADHILCMPHTGGGAGHGNVHHYTLISNAPQLINNNSQSGKLHQPRLDPPHLTVNRRWSLRPRANIHYCFPKGQNVGSRQILHAKMFVYVCAMRRHNAHWVVRPTSQLREGGGSAGLMCLLTSHSPLPVTTCQNISQLPHRLAQNFRTFLWSLLSHFDLKMLKKVFFVLRVP